MTLPADVARCPGVGDEEGWREGCCDCLRRTAPPIDHPHVPPHGAAANHRGMSRASRHLSSGSTRSGLLLALLLGQRTG